MKILIVTTCLAVLGAVGWYAYSEFADHREDARRQEVTELIQRKKRCMEGRELLAAWYNGDKQQMYDLYGDRAEENADLIQWQIDLCAADGL